MRDHLRKSEDAPAPTFRAAELQFALLMLKLGVRMVA
jgi:hypothetical protein